MGRDRPPVFEVHVAGEPGDSVQRCVPCGAALPAPDGPSWWPSGAMVATDKRRDGTGGGMTYRVDRGDLADDERPCTAAR
jgi:hypothetical protein